MIINSTIGINNNKSKIIDKIVDTIPDDCMSCLLLPCNVEIRSYLLDANAEISSKQLMSRCQSINVSKTTYVSWGMLYVFFSACRCIYLSVIPIITITYNYASIYMSL
jgi:hypothetical protein